MNKKLIAIIIIILAIWGLCFAMIAKHNRVSCEKCVVEYKNYEVSGHKLEEPMLIPINVTYLFESYLKEECPITWSRTGGYRDERKTN